MTHKQAKDWNSLHCGVHFWDRRGRHRWERNPQYHFSLPFFAAWPLHAMWKVSSFTANIKKVHILNCVALCLTLNQVVNIILYPFNKNLRFVIYLLIDLSLTGRLLTGILYVNQVCNHSYH